MFLANLWAQEGVSSFQQKQFQCLLYYDTTSSLCLTVQVSELSPPDRLKSEAQFSSKGVSGNIYQGSTALSTEYREIQWLFPNICQLVPTFYNKEIVISATLYNAYSARNQYFEYTKA